MKPMTRRTAMGSATTEWPATRPSPDVGRSKVARNRIVVLLPAPLGPMKPKTSPLPIVKLRSSTATKSPYRLVKFITSIMNPRSPRMLSRRASDGGSSPRRFSPLGRDGDAPSSPQGKIGARAHHGDVRRGGVASDGDTEPGKFLP